MGASVKRKQAAGMCEAFDRHHQQAEEMKRRSELEGAASGRFLRGPARNHEACPDLGFLLQESLMEVWGFPFCM